MPQLTRTVSNARGKALVIFLKIRLTPAKNDKDLPTWHMLRFCYKPKNQMKIKAAYVSKISRFFTYPFDS